MQRRTLFAILLVLAVLAAVVSFIVYRGGFSAYAAETPVPTVETPSYRETPQAPATAVPTATCECNKKAEPVRNYFPHGWGQEDRMPFESGNGSMGHKLFSAKAEFYNGTHVYHIITVPGLSVMPAEGYEGTRWLSDMELNDIVKQAQYDIDVYVAGRDGVKPQLFVVDSLNSEVPTGFKVLEATDETMPAIEELDGTNTGVDSTPESFVTNGVDTPLGDRALDNFGYAYKKGSPEEIVRFFVPAGYVLRIPAGYMGEKSHVIGMPEGAPSDVLVVGRDQMPAGWMVQRFPGAEGGLETTASEAPAPAVEQPVVIECEAMPSVDLGWNGDAPVSPTVSGPAIANIGWPKTQDPMSRVVIPNGVTVKLNEVGGNYTAFKNCSNEQLAEKATVENADALSVVNVSELGAKATIQ